MTVYRQPAFRVVRAEGRIVSRPRRGRAVAAIVLAGGVVFTACIWTMLRPQAGLAVLAAYAAYFVLAAVCVAIANVRGRA